MTTDLQLQQRVIDELEFEPSVNAAHIGVSARDGVVTLAGRVESFGEKLAAERAARRVKGVKAVAQELIVHLPADRKTADDEIAARAVSLLDWDSVVPHGRVTVTVERGIVTLAGTVEWQYQRSEAEQDILKLSGVQAIVNKIVVQPRVSTEDIHAKIRAALERNAVIEAGNITVNVSGSKVSLSGTVDAWTEREAIERAAWSAPGVTQVEDHIQLGRP